MSLHPPGIVLRRGTILGPRWTCRSGRHTWKSRLNAERCCTEEWRRKVVPIADIDTLNAHGRRKGPQPGTVVGWIRPIPPRTRTRGDEIPEAEIPLRVRLAKAMRRKGLYVSDMVAARIDRAALWITNRQTRRSIR